MPGVNQYSSLKQGSIMFKGLDNSKVTKQNVNETARYSASNTPGLWNLCRRCMNHQGLFNPYNRFCNANRKCTRQYLNG